jgi:hypothetical protein
MRLLRENRRATFFAVLATLALLVSFAVVRGTESSGANDLTMQAGTSLDVSCEGTSLTSSATTATSINLDCLTEAPSAPTPVGQATTFESGSSGSPNTSLPSGTAAGDVIVSYVESYSFTTISCPSGWNQVFDETDSAGVELAACVTVATSNQADPAAVVNPPTQVSMVTMAFSGVSTTNPVDASAAAPGNDSPSVTTDTAGTALVFGEGSNGWQLVAQAPNGTTLGATVNDSGNSEAAVAEDSASTSGPTPAASWPYLPSSDSVSGTIALRPATSTSAATSDTQAQSDQSRQMPANSAMSVTCAGTSLTITGTGPTTATLSCLAAQAIAEVGQATTFSSGNSGSPSTAIPTGVTAGDVLVSYVESYAFTSVNCDSGWTETLDVSNGSGA